MKEGKLVYGIGINDADYRIYRREIINGKLKIVWKCPYYTKWGGMLRRCYSKEYQEKYPTYKGCIVHEDWLLFSNFKEWMEAQTWQNRQLDKDFLIEENKMYSPSTCLFIPQELNKFILTRGRARGVYPMGVSYRKKDKRMVNEYNNPYMSMIRNQRGKQVHLGLYSTPKEAHQRYLEEKLKYCKEYLKEFIGEPLVVKGLTRIRDKIQYHIDNNLELTSF